MSSAPLIHLNAKLEIRRQPLGEHDFCVVVDDFLQNPEALVEFAAANGSHFYSTRGGYPGVMLNLAAKVVDELHRFIRSQMARQFGILRGGLKLNTGLAMTVLPPQQLGNFQRICHTDPRAATGRRSYAALVYLFADERLGGTAFYRWKRADIVKQALALELQDPAAATELLAQHCAAFRQPPQYMTGSNELAELLAVIPARFNRMIFYSGEVPHSGYIAAPELLSTNFRQGRLTLNSFVSGLPA